MKPLIQIQFFTMSSLLLLSACVHVKIEEDRQLEGKVESGEAVVLVARPQTTGIAAESEFLDCLQEKLVGGNVDEGAVGAAPVAVAVQGENFHLVPHAAFSDSIYPWLEPSTAPLDSDFVPSLLARPGVREQVEAHKLRYLVSISVTTQVSEKDGNIACSIGTGFVGGCVGLAFWKKESGYEATVWDMQSGGNVGTVGTNVDGRSVFIGAIVPLPFIAPVRSTACRKMAGELRNFLMGKEVSATQASGG